MEQKISLTQAHKEVESWLDRKKVLHTVRDAYIDSIDTLAGVISEGHLVLNEDGTFTHNLLFPIEGERSVTSLNYKHRLSYRELEPHLKGVDNKDGDGRIIAYIACLTDKAKGIIKALDSTDKKIADSIAIFFL